MENDESVTHHLSSVRQSAQDYKARGLAYLDKLPRYGGISAVDRTGFSVDECARLVARFHRRCQKTMRVYCCGAHARHKGTGAKGGL